MERGAVLSAKASQIEIIACPPHWIVGQDGEPELKKLYNRHYSARHYKDGRKPKKFVGPGEHIVLTLPDRSAIFVWRKFLDESGQEGINCSIFRNESSYRSSDLIREADAIADFCWPGERHYTYVRPEAVKSRNPGWCFICAGWKRCGRTKTNLLILEKE
jgi:hypothetical protein